jgi:hypothetical protein
MIRIIQMIATFIGVLIGSVALGAAGIGLCSWA